MSRRKEKREVRIYIYCPACSQGFSTRNMCPSCPFCEASLRIIKANPHPYVVVRRKKVKRKKAKIKKVIFREIW